MLYKNISLRGYSYSKQQGIWVYRSNFTEITKKSHFKNYFDTNMKLVIIKIILNYIVIFYSGKHILEMRKEKAIP